MTLYRVDFLDHCADYAQPIYCAVYGRLILEDEVSLTFETWSMTDPQQEKDLNDTSTFTIIRSTITQLVRLTESGSVSRDATLLSTSGRESADIDNRQGTSLEPSEPPPWGIFGTGCEPETDPGDVEDPEDYLG